MEKQEVLAEFWAAFIAADAERLSNVVDDSTSWYISGRSKLAGNHVGLDAVLAVRKIAEEISGGTLRGSSPDSAAAHHAYVLDLVQLERDGETLSLYVTLASEIKNDRLELAWLYFEDEYAFDAAFS